jgi:hypothetical protein
VACWPGGLAVGHMASKPPKPMEPIHRITKAILCISGFVFVWGGGGVRNKQKKQKNTNKHVCFVLFVFVFCCFVFYF